MNNDATRFGELTRLYQYYRIKALRDPADRFARANEDLCDRKIRGLLWRQDVKLGWCDGRRYRMDSTGDLVVDVCDAPKTWRRADTVLGSQLATPKRNDSIERNARLAAVV